MPLRSTKLQEVSASRKHHLFLPRASWLEEEAGGLSSSEDSVPGRGCHLLSHSRGGGSAPAGARKAQQHPARLGGERHDRARATRDLPGRAGCPGAGVQGRAKGGGRRRAPSPLLLTPGGRRQAAARPGREAACRWLGSAPPGPPRGADSGGSRAPCDVSSPRAIYSAAAAFIHEKRDAAGGRERHGDSDSHTDTDTEPPRPGPAPPRGPILPSGVTAGKKACPYSLLDSYIASLAAVTQPFLRKTV